MTPERHRRVTQVLAGALERDPTERAAFLEEACGEDEALRLEVESLLACEPVEAELIEKPFFSWHPESTGAREGQRIDHYRVLREIAQGGMGAVFLAVREDDVKKKVAVKVLRPDLGSLEETLRRFHSERQILANLEHPNIARFLDGGTTEDGLPYFAMEYVEGEPIDRYCETRNLPVRKRLALFREVCSAVHVAHQNLVVHRDLKPGNILVTREGVPKLLDFGIAKPLSAELTSQVTAPGGAPMTLKYASPEQVRGEQISTASDTYSLGVLLFQLLADEDPYPLDSSSLVEIGRVICEVKPRKPSEVAGQREKERSKSVSPSRDVERRKLRRRLAGDLDSIVLKALRKEPRHRYSSTEELSEDIGRHLEHLPVIARKGSFTYLAGKSIRRNKLVFAALLLIIGSGTTTTVLWRQAVAAQAEAVAAKEKAVTAEEEAVHQRDRAENALDFIKSSFRTSDPNKAKGRSLTALDVLEEGKRKVDELDDPALKAEVLDTLGSVYRDLGRYQESRELLKGSLDILRALHPGDHTDLAKAINNWAGLLARMGEHEEAEALYREALSMRRRLGEEAEIDKAMCNLATILMGRGAFAEAEGLYQECLRAREETYGSMEPDVAMSLRSLGTLYYTWGKLDQAEPYFRRAHDIFRQVLEPRHTQLALTFTSLGRLRLAQERYEEAEALLREALGIRRERLAEHHPHVALSKKDLAELLLARGDVESAEALLNEALATLRESKPEDSWEIADTKSLLGVCLAGRGRYQEAEPSLVESYRILEQARGPYAVYTKKALKRIVDLYTAWGEPEKVAEYRDIAEKARSDDVTR